MGKKVSSTAIGPTVMVAIEQYLPEDQMIIKDHLSCKMLPLTMRLFLKLMNFDFFLRWMIDSSEQSMPGIWGGILSRKFYINEILNKNLENYQEIINLGAGFDTRLFNYNNKQFKAWELDLPKVIKTKQKRVDKLFPYAHENINLVGVDFDRQNLREILLENSYSFNKKTFIIIEGVSQYVTKEGIENTLDVLSDVKIGSELVLTYVLKDLIEGQQYYGQKAIYDKYVIKEKTWINGYRQEEIEELLNSRNWKIIEDKNLEELSNKFEKIKNRNLKTTVIERIVHAKKI